MTVANPEMLPVSNHSVVTPRRIKTSIDPMQLLVNEYSYPKLKRVIANINETIAAHLAEKATGHRMSTSAS